MISKRLHLVLLSAFLFFSYTKSAKVWAQGTAVPDHQGWTALLEKHISDNGLVDYQGFVSDKTMLNAYAQLLSDNPPAPNWTRNEQIAYWINAYNVFTVKLIVENYPLESIKDLNPILAIPTVRSIWSKEWFQIGEELFSLDRIEHKILRREFDEPRIHFAINCASISCPVLRAEAYEPAILDSQLDEQARLFLNDTTRNLIDPKKPKVSKIFSWFTDDFTNGQTVVEFINQYSDIQIAPKTRLRFLEYDWALNDTKGVN